LPQWYEDKLRETYDPKMIQRLIEGKWVYISTDVIYYEYNSNIHISDEPITISKHYPLRLSYDFNIGKGKPMSCVIFQYLPNAQKPQCKIIDEVVMEGTRTADTLDEIKERGYLKNNMIIIHGDASGRHRDTRGHKSDYDIIEEYLRKEGVQFDIDVPKFNPSIRDRHNIVNGQLRNSKGEVNIIIDKRAETLDEGLTKTKLVDGGKYIEDDSKPYQHITTALGYGLMRAIQRSHKVKPVTAR
jgi:hypothetical protein